MLRISRLALYLKIFNLNLQTKLKKEQGASIIPYCGAKGSNQVSHSFDQGAPHNWTTRHGEIINFLFYLLSRLFHDYNYYRFMTKLAKNRPLLFCSDKYIVL